MQEHRMENYEGQDIEFISVWGKIGKVDFANLTEALKNASSEDVVEYILDHAREELESMFMEDFLDWVKEEVGYAYDDKDYKAFGLLEVEHD